MLRSTSLALACGTWLCAVPAAAEPPYSGGRTTTAIFDTSAFSLPAANLPLTRKSFFFAGNSFFTNPWVSAPASTTARDGLGPLFNTNACQSCHLKDGRGRAPRPGEPAISMLVRTSLPSASGVRDEKLGVIPEPTYGDQIQTHALPGMRSEAQVEVQWQEIESRFADGSTYRLRRPRLALRALAYGPLRPDAELSARVAPALVGMGLLETIPAHEIAKRADPDDVDRDGISGRVNRVWDVERQTFAPGRFGWKAGMPSVRQQIAAAFSGDLGITSALFPESSCTPAQRQCRDAPVGSAPELGSDVLELVTFYVKTLAVPARRRMQVASVKRGETLFRDAGCASCHVERAVTGDDPRFPELSQQEIHPYTDLLLHDMGEGLADGRAEFAADGREWRTPPLWGVGLLPVVSRHGELLHDGRARNLEEAILWHGGEAEAAQRAYRTLSKQDRAQLVLFLESL
jgi:CxxC motif-containing protein (DUF1111 family)